MPRLYLLSGPDIGKSFDVAPGATFGRAAECTVHLRDVSVSRMHARLEFDGGRWTIVDAQSRNGLSVRGQHVTSAALADGDEFTLGDVLLRFRADSTPATSAGAAPLPAAAQVVADANVARAPSADEASIELEGEWSGATLSFPSARPLAETASVPRPESSPRADPVAPAPSAGPAAVARAPAGARAAAAGDRSRAVLQYQRIAQRDGLFNADLAQLPIWARIALYLLAAAVAAGLFFIAFRGTLFLKERAPSAGSTPAAVEHDPDD